MHCIMQSLQKNAQVCIHSLADLQINYCVELTFREGKLGRFPMWTFLKWSFLNLLHFESESEKMFNSDENSFLFISRFLDLYHKYSTQVALKEGQLDTMIYL